MSGMDRLTEMQVSNQTLEWLLSSESKSFEMDASAAQSMARELLAHRRASQAAPAHEDDLAVDRFAAVMKAKLAKKRDDGRGGWSGPECSEGSLSRMLRDHVVKGDPVDVANFAMMLHQRGERIAQAAPALSDGLREAWIAGRDAAAAEAFYACGCKDSIEALTPPAAYSRAAPTEGEA